MMRSRNLVTLQGLPPWQSWREAGGQAQGGPANAAVDLSLTETERGTWAYNPLYSEWQLLHTVRSGDTLTRLAGAYYGQANLVTIRKIGHVEQNKPILGPSFDQAVPGDVILIPGLQQPAAQTPALPPPAGAPPPGGTPTPQPGDPPAGGAGWTWDNLPADPPPGWDLTMPWPPVNFNWPGETPADQPAGGETPTGPPDEGPPEGGPDAILAGDTRLAKTNGKAESWWTPTRIALIGVLGVSTVGLITWGIVAASKKPKRRRPRRRTTAPRRRRRR